MRKTIKKEMSSEIAELWEAVGTEKMPTKAKAKYDRLKITQAKKIQRVRDKSN